jgi:hypothetical protein
VNGDVDFFAVCAAGWVALLVVVFTAIPISTRRRQRARWQAVAAAQGLDYSAPGWLGNPRLSGRYRSRPITLQAKGALVGRYGPPPSTDALTSLVVASSLRLNLEKKGLERQLAEAVVHPAAQVGDVVVDTLYAVNGEPAVEVATLVRSTALRPHLLKPYFFSVNLTGQALLYRQQGVVADPQPLLDAVCDFAEVVEAHAVTEHAA